MAKINKGHNHLEEKARNAIILAIVFYIPPIIYFYAFIVHRFHFDGPFHLLGIVPAAIGTYYWRQYSIFKSGVSGKEVTTSALANLPNTYEVFSPVEIPYYDESMEIKNVIIGENGIFIVEVKNQNGMIVGSEESRTWTQY